MGVVEKCVSWLRPGWLALRPVWLALRPAWLALRPDWLGLRPAWLALGLQGGARTSYGRTDGRKISTFYRTSSPIGAAAQKAVHVSSFIYKNYAYKNIEAQIAGKLRTS